MKFPRSLRSVALVLTALFALSGDAALAKEKAREEVLMIFNQRRVSIAVPEGFLYSSEKDERGLITARLADPKEKVSLQISFVPDANDECSTTRGRKEFMVQSFQQYVTGSVEQGMRFEELDPGTGAGTYCVFTDSSLVGKDKIPKGEYLNSTAGVKVWDGCLAIFTLFSNDTKSEEYRAILKLLRESVTETPSPLKPKSVTSTSVPR